MTKIYETKKFFAVTAVLFVAASIVNLSASTPIMSPRMALVSAMIATDGGQSNLGPTLPPSPWDDASDSLVSSNTGTTTSGTTNLGPTLPPSPWDDASDNLSSLNTGKTNLGPTLPPSPWDDASDNLSTLNKGK